MPDISKIKLPDGTTYTVKDTVSGYTTPETFLVNATITAVSAGGIPTGGTTDKSAAEIYAAAAAGMIPIIKVSMQSIGMVYLLASLSLTENPTPSTTYARFIYEDQSNPTFQYATVQVIGNNFTIEFAPPYLKSGGWDRGGMSIENQDGTLVLTNPDFVNNNIMAIDHQLLHTEKTTQAVYPITIDDFGHIQSAGSAVTIPTQVTESTVSGWGFTKNAGTVTGVTAGTGLTGGTISTSGTIALDTTRAITASDITTGTDTTNKLVSAKVIADAIAGAGGGGEGFKITLSLSGQTYSVDKTFAEIQAAVAAKQYVYLYDATCSVVQSDCIILPYTGSMQGDAVFEYLDGSTQILYSIYLDGSDTKVWLTTNTIGGSGVQSVSGTSPVSVTTSSGTATVSLANGYGDTKNPYGTKSANTVLAGPVSGSAASPTFRELVRSDQFFMVTPQDLTDSQFLDQIAQMFPVYRFGMNVTSGGEEIFVELYSVGPVNHETTWIGSDIYGIRYWLFDGTGTKVTDNYFEYPAESGRLALEGGNDFFIELLYDDMEEEYSVDKTFLEIDAAYAAGKKLYMILPEDNTISAYQGALAPIPLTETFWSPDPVSSTLLGMYVFSAEYPFSSRPTDVKGSRNSICVSIDDSDTLRVGEYPVKNIEITKVEPTTSTTYYGVFTNSNGTSLFKDGGLKNGIAYRSRAGTTSTNGVSGLILGNGTNSGSNGNRYGYVSLYPQNGDYTNSIVSTGTLTANRTLLLPDKSGILATTDDITAAINALDASNTSY